MIWQQFVNKKPQNNSSFNKIVESTKNSSEFLNKILKNSEFLISPDDQDSNENYFYSRNTGYANKMDSQNQISILRNSIQEGKSKLESNEKEIFLEFNLNQNFQSQNQSPAGFRKNQNFLDQLNKTQSYNFPDMKSLKKNI